MSHPFSPNDQYPGAEVLAYLEDFASQVQDQTAAIINQRNSAQNGYAEQAMTVGFLDRKCSQLENELSEKNRKLAEANQQLAATQQIIESMQRDIDRLSGDPEQKPDETYSPGELSDYGDDSEEHS